ncbi:agmatinase [Halocola ammonii]
MKQRTFAGIEENFHDLSKAEIVLLPVPYDGTSTWVKGADRGPDAFLEAAENMEIYDIETESEVFRHGIHLAEAIKEKSSPEAMTDAVHKAVAAHLSNKKFVTLFGGEHSISIGSIRAFMENYSDLTVLQIDAHADLRPEYHGSKCNHACALYEASQKANLIQVGIRSMDISEREHMNEEQVYFAHHIRESRSTTWISEMVDHCTDNVYITIDLDAFDPGIMPSTGTPEPGGLTWYQVLDIVKAVNRNKNIVGFDIVELCPNENNKAPDFLAAKLYYKMLSYIFNKHE